METRKTRSSDPVTPESAFREISKAIAALPMPFGIYDANDRLILCSDQIKEKLCSGDPDATLDLLETTVTFADVAEKNIDARLPKDIAQKKVETQLQSHKLRKSQVQDVNEGGRWKRRARSVAPEGQIVTLTMPIHELVEKSEALSKAKQQLEHLAFHDPLTGLPNRRGLSEHLDKLSCVPEREAYNVAVLHVDLDKFKLVNDTLGHDAGDVVLSEAAKRLRTEVRTTDLVARVGGDEFVVLIHSVPDEAAIANIAQRIVDRMAIPIKYNDEKCQIGASIGVAITSAHNISEHVLMDADIALYEAKNKGRGRYEFFYPVFRHRYSTLQKRINEVRDAVALNAFEPFFQPQICATTGDLIGLEALARWRDREQGIRQPTDFMDALQEAHQVDDLDEMILRKTLRAIRLWDAEGCFVPRVTMNLSESRLRQSNLVDHMKWALDSEDVSIERVGLEILENVVVGDDADIVAHNITQLSKAGFKMALDDFGTGNASIAGLRNLSLDSIKIDRSFVTDVENDAELRMITGAMISLARNLKMEAICEGVETQAQVQVLRELGAAGFQGFLFSKAMDADFVPIWMQGFEEDRAKTALIA